MPTAISDDALDRAIIAGLGPLDWLAPETLENVAAGLFLEIRAAMNGAPAKETEP
jgi:hypothetical protein